MKRILLMAIVLTSLLTYVSVSAFTRVYQVPKDGYIIESENVYESLTEHTKLNFSEVSQDDAIYKRANRLYLNKTSFKFSEDYPLILKNISVVNFFNDSAILIARDFYQNNSFGSMYLASGISFNEDFTQADYEEYILARLADGSYMNAQLIKVETSTKKTYIDNSSFIYFGEDQIIYESIKEGKVVKDSIDSLFGATISIGQNKFSYADFYNYLKSAETDPSFTIDDDKIEEDITMPSYKPNEIGGAQLTTDENGNIVIDENTVTITDLIENEGDKKAEGENTTDNKGEGEKGENGNAGSNAEAGDANTEAAGDNNNQNAGVDLPSGDISDLPDSIIIDENPGDDMGEGNPSDAEGISREPVVMVGEFTPWVYTAGGKQRVYDFSSRIIGSIKYTVLDETGKTVARRSVGGNSDVVLSVLPPDSNLTIRASYRYYNNNGEKVETGKNGVPVLFEQNIHTLDLEHFTPVKVNVENGDQYLSTSLAFKNLSIENQQIPDEETSLFDRSKMLSTTYIATGEVIATSRSGNTIVLQIPATNISKLKQGKTLDLTIGGNLDSNTNYTYEFKFYDKYGNQIKTDPVTISGETKTQKKDPVSIFNLLTNEAGNITVGFNITDSDAAILPKDGYNYRLRVKNEDGQYALVRAEFNGTSDTGIKYGQEIALNDYQLELSMMNLPFNKYLTIELVADIDLNDDNGKVEDVVIGAYSFFSSGVVSGNITYNTVFGNLGGTYATAIINITPASSLRLLQLMTDMKFTFTDQKNNVISFNLNRTDLENTSFSNGNMTYENGGVTISEGSVQNKTPRIRLVGDYDLFTENAWQALLSGGYSNSDYVSLHIEFLQETLEPSTLYSMNIQSLIEQGLSYYNIETINKNKEFSTLKREPIVHYGEMVQLNNSIQFTDLYITDEDATVLQEPVVMELVWNNIVLDTKKIYIGEENKIGSIAFTDLMDDEQYTIRFKATEFNNGLTMATYARNYIFKKIDFVSNSGIVGKLSMSELTPTPTQIKDGVEMYDLSKNLLHASGDDVNIFYGAYRNYRGDKVNGNTYFYTDYIDIDQTKPLTLFFYKLADESWHGNNPDESYHGSRPSFSVTYYEYDEANKKYTYLGYDNYVAAGDFIDFSTKAYADRIDYITFSGISGYEDVGLVLQGVEPYEIIKISDYSDYYLPETYINGAGNYTSNSSYTVIDYDFKVKPGEIYRTNINSNFHIAAFYDAKGRNIQTNRYYQGSGYLDYGAFDGNLIVVPNNAATMKIVMNTATLNAATFADDQSYYIKKLFTAKDDYYATLTVDIEDNDKTLALNSSYVIKTYVNSTDLNKEGNMVTFKPDLVQVFKTDNEQTIWTYLHDFELDVDKYYRFELYFESNGKEYFLDELEMYTETDWEYIYNFSQLSKIYTNEYGKYKVMADIDVPEGTISGYRPVVQGVLDFNGHKFNMRHNYWGFDVGPDGIIMNAVVNYEFSNGITSAYNSFVYANYGIVKNCIVTVNAPLNYKLTSRAGMLVYQNYYNGTIENCATILNDSIFVEVDQTLTWDPYFSALNCYNYGTVRNCYVAAANPDAKIYVNNTPEITRKVYVGGLVVYNDVSGKLSNSYSILNTSQKTDEGLSQYVGTLVRTNEGNTINCFAVGDRYTFIQQSGQLISAGYNEREFIPATAHDVGPRFDNCYMYTNPSLDYSVAKQCGFIMGDARNLLSKDWYEKSLLFDSYDFEIENNLLSGFYPRLKFNSNMMKYQPYISISGFADQNQNMRVINTVVDLQEKETAVATVYIHNPNRSVIQSIEVENLQATITETSYDEDTHCSVIKVRLAQPQKFVSSYNITGINYKSGNAILSVSDSYPIECEFYRNISTALEWGTYVNNNPNENYRICADLDFSQTNENLIRVSRQFTGKIDGEYTGIGNKKYRYKLKNITLTTNTYVFYDLRGSISNLDIENLKISSGKNKTDHTGFVRYMYGKNAVLDNVHVIGSTINGYNSVGGLAGYVESATIKNCSVTNTNIYDNKPRNDNSSVSIGGLVGYLRRGAVITNSFVSDINIAVSDVKKVDGVGGLVGRIWYAQVENCYTEGKVSNYSKNTGGIVGYNERSIIRNVYSNMKIEGSDVIGGIVGYDYGADVTNHRTYSDFDNMLSMSDIYVKNNSYFEVHRLFGTNNIYGNNLYGTKNQIISPIPKAAKDIKEQYKQQGQIISDQTALSLYEDETWGLLTNNELGKADIYRYKVMMGDEFDYTGTESSRTLPVLKYTDSDKLLPYQDEKFLPLEGVELTLGSAVFDANSDTYTTTFIITHPEGYYADSTTAVISDMKLKTNDTGTTYDPGYDYYPGDLSDRIVLRTEKVKALDSYMFSISLKSKETGSTFEQKLSLSFAYESGPVYWEIPNYSTWREVMSKHGQTGENFKITGEIDFENKVFDYYNLSVNNITGTNENAIIKNVLFTDKTDTEGNRVGFYNLFANVLSFMNNIKFENIQYDMSTVTSNGNYIGVIGQCTNIENVSFNNVTITLPNVGFSYGGVIGYLSGNGKNLDFNNITIRGTTGITRTAGQNYIGSIGSLGGGLINCDFNNVIIDEELTPDKLRTYYVGAAVGYFNPIYLDFATVDSYKASEPDTYSVKVTNCKVNGYQRVGGAIGFGTWNQYGTTIRQLENFTVENVEVQGMIEVGGYQGLYNATRDRLSVKHVNVKGSYSVGGVSSTLNNYTYDTDFNNINVVGGYRVGGVSGSGQGYLYRSTISDVIVHGGLCVGGITGRREGYQLIRDVSMDNIKIYGVDEKTLVDTYHLTFNTDQAQKDGFPSYTVTEGENVRTYILDGSYVGGISGYHNSTDYATQFANSTMTNVVVEGNNYVGGLYGAARGWYSYRSSFDIETTGNDYVGGMIGYVFAGNSNWKHFQQLYVRNDVKGNNYVGGVAGYVENGSEYVGFPTNGDSHNQNYSVILDLSLEATTDEEAVSINYFANTYDPTVPVGAIDQLRYVDRCRMKAGADSSFITITSADLPNLMTAQDDATKTNKYQAKILAEEDLMNFYELFGNRLYTDHLEFNTTIWDYNEDLLIHNDDYLLTKTSANTFELSGLNPNTEYSVQATFDDRKIDDEGLILYFDAKNNTGNGSFTSDSTVWKNLGSLGSDYDLSIIMKDNSVDPSSRYKWENNGLHILGNGGGTADGKAYENTYSSVALISDRNKGRIEMTDSQEYTISVTLNQTNRYSWVNLFGTRIEFADKTGKYSYFGPFIQSLIYPDKQYIYAGRWGTSWYTPTYSYSEINKENYYPINTPTTIIAKLEHNEKNSWNVKIFVNDILIREATGNYATYGSNNYIPERLTDGFLTMLCLPTITTIADGENQIEEINYGFQAFAGTIYSARLYDRALSDEEIKNLYYDEMGYYGLNSEYSVTVSNPSISNVTADSNGKATISLNSSNEGNLKLKLTDTTTGKSGIATLSNVTPNSTCMPLSVYSKKPGTEGSTLLSGNKISADSVWLRTDGSDVKWYRSTANKYDGVEVGTGNELYVSMRGYYYAITGGVQTSIVYLDSPLTFMQLYNETKQTEFIKGSEGRDDTGAWNPVDDVLINGGVRIKQFVNATSASLLSAFHMPVNIIDEELPMLYAYSSGVDTVNLELSYMPENDIYVSVTVDGENVIDTLMDNQTLTFNYDYKTPFMVSWSDGTRSSYKDFDAIDIRNSVSTYGDNYYYLTSRGIGSNNGDIDIMATHIFKDEVITYSDEIINLSTSQRRSANTLWNIVADKPLFEFEYEGDILKTFYAYSSYQGVDFDQQAIIYDGEYYGLDYNMSDRAKSFVIDTYQNKIFVSSIYDNELINWYHNLKTPEEFSNMDIREISCSIESNNPIVLVRYNNGSIVGFDYTNGEELELFSEVEYNFVDYVVSTFSSMFKVSRSSALQGSYAYALSTVEALDASENADVIELFSLAPESDKEGIDTGIGYNVHDTKVKLVFDAENEEFVIDKVASEYVDGKGNSTGHATSTGHAKSNEVNRDLQDKIEEIAEKNNIPGLSNGIKGNTGTVTSGTSVVRVAFIALMAIVSVSAIIAVLSRFTRGKL